MLELNELVPFLCILLMEDAAVISWMLPYTLTPVVEFVPHICCTYQDAVFILVKVFLILGGLFVRTEITHGHGPSWIHFMKRPVIILSANYFII